MSSQTPAGTSSTGQSPRSTSETVSTPNPCPLWTATKAIIDEHLANSPRKARINHNSIPNSVLNKATRYVHAILKAKQQEFQLLQRSFYAADSEDSRGYARQLQDVLEAGGTLFLPEKDIKIVELCKSLWDEHCEDLLQRHQYVSYVMVLIKAYRDTRVHARVFASGVRLRMLRARHESNMANMERVLQRHATEKRVTEITHEEESEGEGEEVEEEEEEIAQDQADEEDEADNEEDLEDE